MFKKLKIAPPNEFTSVSINPTYQQLCNDRVETTSTYNRDIAIIRRKRRWRSKVHSSLIFVLLCIAQRNFFIPWELSTGVKK